MRIISSAALDIDDNVFKMTVMPPSHTQQKQTEGAKEKTENDPTGIT